MKDLDVGEIMTRPVISAKAHTTLRDIALQMISSNYSGMPVTGEKGKLIGIVTEIDILRALNDGKELARSTASDVMTAEVVTARPDIPITEAISVMENFNIIRLPVVKDGRLVGVVSRGDILQSLLEPEFEANM